jgi:hypothetical protein
VSPEPSNDRGQEARTLDEYKHGPVRPFRAAWSCRAFSGTLDEYKHGPVRRAYSGATSWWAMIGRQVDLEGFFRLTVRPNPV